MPAWYRCWRLASLLVTQRKARSNLDGEALNPSLGRKLAAIIPLLFTAGATQIVLENFPRLPLCMLGARRLLSSPAPTGAPSPTAAAKGQSQLHRGKKADGEERRLWPYLKAARQQFFNVILATLSIVMAVKMVEGKVRR